VTKATFEQLGKFPQVPLMEDFIFIRTAAMKEAHIAVVYQPVITSSRRWQYITQLSICLHVPLFFTNIKPTGSLEFGKRQFSTIS
jgi:hypothetical protein